MKIKEIITVTYFESEMIIILNRSM